MAHAPDREELLDRLEATDRGPLAPSREQWRRHLEQKADEPFVVINLLTLRDPEALDRYAALAVPKVRALGAELVYLGRSDGVLVGNDEDGCDVVSVWRWPTRTAWTELWTDPAYAEIRPLFQQGVRRYRCISSTPQSAVAEGG